MAAKYELFSSDPTKKKLLQTSISKMEGSVTIDERNFHGEIRSLKRRHVLRSPQIVITCPADSVRQAFVCRACSAGPVCCVDPSAENRESFSVNQRVSLHYNGSDGDDYEGSHTCSECGSVYSESSDWSSSSSENGHDTEQPSSPMKRFTSIDNLHLNSVESNLVDAFTDQRNNGGTENQSSSSENEEEEDDEEEVILVQIDRDLKDVVDNHIRSRKNSVNSSDAESSEDAGSLSPARELPSTKESEILQRFLQQVETHPQEEDLDVILEIVGEEDEEPCNRSKVNIRECTERFKDIYARKLKEIYHRKYKNSLFNTATNRNFQNTRDQFDFESQLTREKITNQEEISRSSSLEDQLESSKSMSNSDHGQDDFKEPIEHSTKIFVESQQLREHSSLRREMELSPVLTGSTNMRSRPDSMLYRSMENGEKPDSKFNRVNPMMIDKLPEIRQFHPNNIDPKISREDRTYLKATSLINEIESCFKETALLVEKSIGSNKAPVYVLRSDVETQKQQDFYRNSNFDAEIMKEMNDDRKEGQNYSSCSYNIPRDEKNLNEYQSFWNSVGSAIPSPTQIRESENLQNNFFTANKNSSSSSQSQHFFQQLSTKSISCDPESDDVKFRTNERCANELSTCNSMKDSNEAETEHGAYGCAKIRLGEEESYYSKNNKTQHLLQKEDAEVAADHIPRTLEESIEIFEMILDDRRSESRKSYDSGLSSSTLVLNSSKFLKENSIESSERCSKYSSTNDLACVSDDDCFNRTWTLGRNRNKFKSVSHLGDKLPTRNNYFHSKFSSEINDSSHDFLQQGLGDGNVSIDGPSTQNSYKKFDSFDLFNDDDHDVSTKNSYYKESRFNSLYKRSGEVGSRNRSRDRDTINTSKSKIESKQFDTPVENMDTTLDCPRKKRDTTQQRHSQRLSQWRSEPDFGKLTFPSFGFQSSSSEEYYERDYLTTSITTSSFKNRSQSRDKAIEEQLSLKEENEMLQEEDGSRTAENASSGFSGGTMGILNEQPLFAQVDELLRGLNESRVDCTSESDEGVVSDQSDISEINQSERIKCASVSEIMEAIDGSNGDDELEKNVEQIVHGINSIKEKHLGRKIEKELESYIRPKIELLRENISSSLMTSSISEESNKMEPRGNENERKRSIEEEAANLSEKIKKLAELPEIRDIIAKMDQQSAKSFWKLQVSNELNAIEQISQASDELKTLGFVTDGINFSSNLKSCPAQPRCSRRERFERHMISRQTQRSNDCMSFKRASTRSSSCFSFFEGPESRAVSDLNGDQVGFSLHRVRERSPPNANVPPDSRGNRNSFIMKMLHQNLRCYVITLAFLEKLLNDDVNQQEPSFALQSKEFFDNIYSGKSETTNLGFAALEKAVSMLPVVAGRNSVSGLPTASPFDIGHQAFLMGLQRQHLVETQRQS